jgi:hypothetical protein
MAVATGNGVRMPLTLAPKRSAAAVSENTSAAAEIIRSGRSHLSAVAKGFGESRSFREIGSDGSIARAANSAATAMTNATIGPTWTR